jgi:uncharacterized protein (DUF2141 family)
MTRSLHSLRFGFVLGIMALVPAIGSAETTDTSLTVVVTGVPSDAGIVSCALFAGDEGFPMEAADDNQQTAPAHTGTVEFRFEGLAPGTYAVAVSHDRNTNGRTDTNFLGIPKEAWGVSNNVRPGLRPPRFTEAAFKLEAGDSRTVEIAVK